MIWFRAEMKGCTVEFGCEKWKVNVAEKPRRDLSEINWPQFTKATESIAIYDIISSNAVHDINWRGTYILSQKNDEIALNTIESILILWTFGSDSGSLVTSAIHKHGTGENMLHGRIGTVGPGSHEILFWKAWEQRFTACSLGEERRGLQWKSWWVSWSDVINVECRAILLLLLQGCPWHRYCTESCCNCAIPIVLKWYCLIIILKW